MSTFNSSNDGGGGGMNSSIIQGMMTCFSADRLVSNGLWEKLNPSSSSSNSLGTVIANAFSFPLLSFLLETTFVSSILRILNLFLKPLRQPPAVSEFLVGIVLSIRILGTSGSGGHLEDYLFVGGSRLSLECAAQLGLLYYLFLVGLEMDLDTVRHIGHMPAAIAAAATSLPFLVSVTASALIFTNLPVDADTKSTADHPQPAANMAAFHLIVGAACTATTAPMLAHILTQLKLLNTELGRIAMPSAMIGDLAAWAALAVAVAIAGSPRGSEVSGVALVVITTAAFFAASIRLVRPSMSWLAQQTPRGESPSQLHQSIVILGVLLFSFLTEAIGVGPSFGAFIFGLVMPPDNPVAATVSESLHGFVFSWMLPLFVASVGLRYDMEGMSGSDSKAVAIVVLFAAVGALKVAVVTLAAPFFAMSFHEGAVIGILMTAKGIFNLLILRVGIEKEILTGGSMTAMAIVFAANAVVVSPLVTAVYWPWRRRQVKYKRRNLQLSRPESELRMLCCIHNDRNVPSMISLLEASNPTKRCPIFVYALHLVELTGRASNMLITHSSGGGGGAHGRQRNKAAGGGGRAAQAQSEHVISAFESYEQHAGGVSVQTLTALSPYSSMHEDICSIAEDKHVTFILLPFHKHQTVDGGMEVTHPAINDTNVRVMAGAPCSVGILVDRGISGAAKMVMGGQHVARNVAAIFVGGPDDREALSYAGRMAEHPAITLSVFRFIPGAGAGGNTASCSSTSSFTNNNNNNNNVYDSESSVAKIMPSPAEGTAAAMEAQADEDFISEFRARNRGYETTRYVETVVSNSEETVASIRAMEDAYDLYIVGRGTGSSSSLTAGMEEWSECPELGPIGDLLVSSDLGKMVSVLVIQQYHNPTPSSTSSL